jgi:hypothetical protein
MIDIKLPDYDAPEYDICGYHEVVAILEVNNMKIPLCLDCIKELTESLKIYNSTAMCYKCKNFIKKNELHYGGSCLYKAENDGVHLEKMDIGYKYHVDAFDGCERFI